MTSERRTRNTRFPWLTLVWLGAFLMLGALALPARATAGGFVAPAASGVPSPADAAGRVRAALTAQGYTVTDVGLSGDGLIAGVMMRPASYISGAALQEQVRAGWQALAVSYPHATWLLSGYTDGDRYRVCFFRPAQTPSSSTCQASVYDTLLGRWLLAWTPSADGQPKDLTLKDFGYLARPASISPTEPPTASNARPDDLSGQPAGPRVLPSLNQIADSVAMRAESRRRWLPGPDHTPDALVGVPTGPGFEVSTASAGLSVLSRAPVAHAGPAAEARWHTQAYPVRSDDAGEDPIGDPPPTHRPLLCPRPTSDPAFSLLIAFPYLLHPAPAIRSAADADAVSSLPQYLLAWPTLWGRPPPCCAPRRLI